MSGICALLRLDGGLAERATLAPVLGRLATRGPDGAGIVADGPAALGHALLATTPEALIEAMPLRHGPTGCLVTADARLDNRDELIAALGLDPAGRVIGDGELIAAAYGKWGLDCPGRLLGDFAFVVWDPRCQRLFAARDKAGMRQLIYHHAPGHLFACATDADALIANPQVPRRLNEGRIADYVEQLEAIDYVSTFYLDVLRLPPAHALVVEGGNLRQWRYWELAPTGPILRLGSDAEYEAAFLDVFTKAVRARLRSPEPVGSMLSGGMDSGSVTAIAARLLQQAGAPPLATFSGLGDDPACAESACVRDSAATIPHIAPHLIAVADAGSFGQDIRRLTETQSDPFDNHMALIRAIYLAARRSGIKVMLDGVSGDSTLGTGNMIAYHLRRGEVLTAVNDARAQERIWGAEASATTALRRAAWRVAAPAWLQQRRRDRWERLQHAQAAAESLVDPDLAARVDMPARRRAAALHVALGDGCDPAAHARHMLHPYVIVGRERYDRVAGAIGIEPRDPFLDVRLLEFCLTLPPEQIHARGWAKMILRRAMAGMLPDSVRWKRGRDHVGWRFVQSCTEARLSDLDDAVCLPLCGYVRDAACWRDFALQCSSHGVASESDFVYLARWITEFKTTRN